jgi:hypothetical protein
VVEPTHAVADPGTVMVHPLDAPPADPAVMHSLLLDEVALETVAQLIESLYLLTTS